MLSNHLNSESKKNKTKKNLQYTLHLYYTAQDYFLITVIIINCHCDWPVVIRVHTTIFEDDELVIETSSLLYWTNSVYYGKLYFLSSDD